MTSSRPLFAIWQEIRAWCLTPLHDRFAEYGGRGITCAAAWEDYAAFAAWALAHGYQPGWYLVRLDPDGPFSPENCRWEPLEAHLGTGGRGQRRVVFGFGTAQTVKAWARDPRCVVTYSTLLRRLRHGIPLEAALTTPADTPDVVYPRRRYRAFGEDKTLAAWRRDPRCLVSRELLESRLAEGWVLEEALTTPRGDRRNRPWTRTLEAFGERKLFSTWLHDPRCQVGEETLRERLQAGWEVEAALSTPRQGPAKVHLLTLFGETQSITAWARDPRSAVSLTTFASRLQEGWSSPALALLIPKDVTRNAARRITAFGETHGLTRWTRDPRCRAPRELVIYRLMRGHTPEEALHQPPTAEELSRFGPFAPRSPHRHTGPHLAVKKRHVLERLWRDMVARCTDPAHPAYPEEGGRGIRVCAAWAECATFIAWAKANRYSIARHLVRLDASGDYTPDNCRIRTVPHANNLKQGPRLLTAFGETKTLVAWVDDPRCVVSHAVLYRRLINHWEAARALTTPENDRTSWRNARVMTLFGETKTYHDWLRDPRCVVGQTTVFTRLKAGWEFEAALTTPRQPVDPLKQGYAIHIFDEVKTILDWSKDARCRVSRATLTRRLEAGWDPERALATPADPSAVTTRIIEAFGERKTIGQWVRDARCRVRKAEVLSRLGNGWEPERALTTVPGEP